jgi:hypothetical protein
LTLRVREGVVDFIGAPRVTKSIVENPVPA